MSGFVDEIHGAKGVEERTALHRRAAGVLGEASPILGTALLGPLSDVHGDGQRSALELVRQLGVASGQPREDAVRAR
ncbi:MAG TPA: hypothetical protein RMH99_02390, partial [Sandaracinaceae bacterium LLY-WYZ-13_1]|nr:hypothetical protein [Sandaracinaceae bacterium LLY-WYZ-13_1]